MKAYLLCVLFLMGSVHCFGQALSFPKKVKKGEDYIVCISERGLKSELRVIKNPSIQVLEDIQIKLMHLNYKIQKTGLLDTETKQAILEFNKKECGICSPLLNERTLAVLKSRYKRKLRKAKKMVVKK